MSAVQDMGLRRAEVDVQVGLVEEEVGRVAFLDWMSCHLAQLFADDGGVALQIKVAPVVVGQTRGSGRVKVTREGVSVHRAEMGCKLHARVVSKRLHATKRRVNIVCI